MTFSEIDFALKSIIQKREEISSLYENIISDEFRSIKKCLKKRLSDVCEKITDGTHQTPKYFNEGDMYIYPKKLLKVINILDKKK